MRLLLIVALLLLLVVAVFLLLRPSGPRVTHIEHKREEVDEDRDA